MYSLLMKNETTMGNYFGDDFSAGLGCVFNAIKITFLLLVGWAGYTGYQYWLADQVIESKKIVKPDVRIEIKNGKSDTTYIYRFN